MADESGTPVGGVTVEIRAPLDKLNSDFSAAENRTRQADQAMSAAMGKTKESTTALAQAQLALIDAYNKGSSVTQEMTRAVGGYKAAQDLLANSTKAAAEAQAVLGAAQKATTAATVAETATTTVNTASKAAQAEMLAKAAAAAGPYTRMKALEAAAEDADTAATVVNTGAHVSSRASYEGLVIVHEALSGRFSRMSSSGLILGQALLGNAKTAALLAAAMSPVGIAVEIAAVAMIFATKAALDYDAAQKQLTVTAVGLGAASGASSVQLEASAQAAQGASTITLGAARQASEAFAAAGVQSQDTITYLSASVEDFAHLTGQKTPEAIKTLAQAMADPAKGAAELNEQFHFLDDTELRNIQTLAELGDKTGAQNALAHAFYQRVNEASAASGGFDSWLQQLKRGMDRLSDSTGNAVHWLQLFQQYGLAAPGIEAQAQANQAALQGRIQAHARLVADSTAADADIAATPEQQDAARRTQLQGSLNRTRTAMAADRQLGDTAGYARAAQAAKEYQGALDSLRPAAERDHQISLLQAQSSRTKSAAQKGAIAAQIEALRLGGQVMSDDERQQRASDAAVTASAKRTGAAHQHRDAVAEETTKIAANTTALTAEAEAYLKADSAAAFRIEAQRQASEYAATHPKANVAAMTGLFMAEDVAKAADTGAKRVSQINDQTEALRRLNQEVAAGTLTAQQANSQAKDEAQINPLLAAQANATGAAKEQLKRIIDALRAAQHAQNAEEERSQVLADTEKLKERNAQLALEGALIGQNNRQRAVAIAQQQAEAYLKAHPNVTGADATNYTAAQVAGANQGADNADASFVQRSTQAIQSQVAAMQAQARAFGMTNESATAFLETQKLLDQAAAAGLDLTPEQIAAIKKLGEAYAQADTAAKAFQERAKASADAAKGFGDAFADAIDGLAYGGKNLKDTLHDLVKTLGQESLQGLLKGEGPFAGLLGTSKTNVQGGANGGILSQLFGSVFHQPGASLGNLTAPLTGGGSAAGVLQGPVTPGSVLDKLTNPLSSLGGLGGGSGGSDPLSALMGIFGGSPGSVGAAGGGFGELAGLFHDGTPSVGSSTPPMRSVAPGMFINAPRLHKGLMAGEFPAILQEGEEVVPRGGRGRGGNTYNLHVHGVSDNQSWRRNNRQVMRDFQQKASAAR